MKKNPDVPYLLPRQIVGRQQTSNKPDVHFEHRNFSILQQPKQKHQTLVVARFTVVKVKTVENALKTRQSIRAELRQQDQSGAVVFLHSIRAPRSISPSCRHFCKKKKPCSFCLFTCFIIYAVNCKLLQNKLKWSRKVTQKAVRPVTAAGGGS